MQQAIRGFRDILPSQSELFYEIEKTAMDVFAVYNYSSIRIPTVEYKDLFVKSTGETTDIVQKEMYSFLDASQRQLALRPEGTPGVARAYINNNLNLLGKNTKFFYIGNMFRAERPQAGRFREFEQIGVENIGTDSPYSDAEVILMLDEILKKLNLSNYKVEINSIGCLDCRKKYREKLISYLKSKEDLCQWCLSRMETNPLRTLDCKNDGHKFTDIPKIELCEGCKTHHIALKEALSPIKYEENLKLVRGLDYYSRTVFEFKTSELGAQDAIAAGGRYDNLIKSMGGPDSKSVGWAMGVDRIAMLLQQKNSYSEKNPSVFVVCAKENNAKFCFNILATLREAGIRSDFSDFALSFKSQMRSADKSGAKFVAIIGDEEASQNFVSLKNLETKKQEKVSPNETANFIKRAL